MELTQLAEQYGINLATTASLVTLIMVLVATLKKYVPQIQGNITVAVSGVFAILGGMATAWDKGLVPIIISAVIVFIGTTGIWEVIKKNSGEGGTK